VAILKALFEAKIEIPFGQVDVNLRNSDAVKRLVVEALEEERAGQSSPPPGNKKRMAGE
jgi:small-conductance mechanosensitive channel